MKLRVVAIDPDHDSLRYTLNFPARNMHWGNDSGVFQWHPSYNDAGSYRWSAVVNDGSEKDSVIVQVNVANVNRPPFFVRLPDSIVCNEGEQIHFAAQPIDPDGDSVRVALIDKIEGASLDNHEFVWTPSYRQAGIYNIHLGADDGELTSVGIVHTTVHNVNHQPTLVRLIKPPNRDTLRVVSQSKPIVFAWMKSADEDDDDTLRYTLHFSGIGIDTSISGLTDTTVAFVPNEELRTSTWFAWTITTSDGWSAVPSSDLFLIRTPPGNPVARPAPPGLPKNFHLEYSLSSPLSSRTTVRYDLPERSETSLKFFNMLGEPMFTLVEGIRDAGSYDTTFDTGKLGSGIYMMQMEARPVSGSRGKDFVSTKKVIFVR
ncbi:MAG: hypothetical protein HY966_00875 [Ignavibacteriales bacterium]|nr:hypothetical protein [Ignavibacteriales bacterium]